MRYSETIRTMTTDLDKYADVVGWIEGLRSRKYLMDILREKHAISDPGALSQTISSLIETSLDYIEQAEKGPGRVAFLPLYYSMLNLAKVYILLGPHRSDLETQRQHRGHGASYDPGWDDSLDLSRQKIRMRPDGVLGLFYRTLTGDPWITTETNISMAKVYPFIDRVGAEYTMIKGAPPQLATVNIMPQNMADGWHWHVEMENSEAPHSKELKYLSVFRPDHWSDWNSAEGTGVSVHSVPDKESLYEVIQCCTRKEMFRKPTVEVVARGATLFTFTVPVQNAFPRMVEEMPILLAFFYQSSIARYKPEFLDKQFDSKLWPYLVGLRRHGSYSFLLAFWGFITQQSISFESV